MCFVAFNFVHFEVNCSCSGTYVKINQIDWKGVVALSFFLLATCHFNTRHFKLFLAVSMSHIFCFGPALSFNPPNMLFFWQVSPPLWTRQKPAVLTTLEPKYSSSWSPTSSEHRQNSQSNSSRKIPSFKKQILTTVCRSMKTSLNHQLTLSSSAGQKMAINTCK